MHIMHLQVTNLKVIGPDNEESSMENFEKVVKKKEKKAFIIDVM